MIPTLTIEPISENRVRILLSTGICIEVSDSGGIGGEIYISENKEKMQFARFKRVKLIPKETGVSEVFKIEVSEGINVP